MRPLSALVAACIKGATSEVALLQQHIDGLVQERRNSIALAMELRLFCTNPSI